MTVRSLLADPATLHGWRGWTARRKLAVGISGALLFPIGFVLILLGRWPRVDAVATGATPEYPYLKPLTFPELPHVVFQVATRVVERMPGWEIAHADLDEGIIQARAVSRPFGFKSDVTITIHRGGSVTQVSVRSQSVGASLGGRDFGQNARNVRRFLKDLEVAVANGTAEPAP